MQFLERIKGCICGGNIWRYMLSDVVYEIKQTFPKYTWVGIYLLDDGVLLLETFLGKATSHTKIPLDKGICGASASQKKTYCSRMSTKMSDISPAILRSNLNW